MTQKKIYFLSDLHLGARYLPDQKLAERRVVDFLRHIKGDAEAVYLLGDVFDYWFEYRTVVPRGHVRFLGVLAELVDAGVKVYWFTGNHDVWLFGYVDSEIGLTVVRGHMVQEIRGKKFYLAHGDGQGNHGLGFKMLRFVFHNRVCQTLFAAIHPRWTVPLGLGWSKGSRNYKKYFTPQFQGIDREPQAQFALNYLREVDPTINYFIFGHRHVVADEKLSPTCRLLIIGDWITQFSYAVYDGENVEIKYWQWQARDLQSLT